MKWYIGTKQVKAEPMTRTEAEELLGRNLTSKGEYGEEGYLVEYEDGYKSWSPKEIFDKAYKLCEGFEDRLHIELDELNDRLTKLNTALGKDDFQVKVGDVQYKLMQKQSEGMKQYLEALTERIFNLQTIDPAGN